MLSPCFQFGLFEYEYKACPCTRTHRLKQKYASNEATVLILKCLKYTVWAQKKLSAKSQNSFTKVCQVLGNNPGTWDKSIHRWSGSLRLTAAQRWVWGEIVRYLEGVFMVHADIFLGLVEVLVLSEGWLFSCLFMYKLQVGSGCELGGHWHSQTPRCGALICTAAFCEMILFHRLWVRSCVNSTTCFQSQLK